MLASYLDARRGSICVGLFFGVIFSVMVIAPMLASRPEEQIVNTHCEFTVVRFTAPCHGRGPEYCTMNGVELAHPNISYPQVVEISRDQVEAWKDKEKQSKTTDCHYYPPFKILYVGYQEPRPARGPLIPDHQALIFWMPILTGLVLGLLGVFPAV